ncbi:hypothetical protein LF887_03470 [Chryseobacterium sp. MEBOG06]|nr:hypothetical protein [Chryseobacterium sp. MEBOG06]UKB84716.1 hypothetical protein LF887_03470 [Chryseobacterium sp. MEBOG06]
MKTIKKVALTKSIVAKNQNVQTLLNPVDPGTGLEPGCRSTTLSQLQP